MLWPFKRKKEPAQPVPEPGQVFEFRPSEADPFQNKEMGTVTVLEVKQQWVRFQVGSGYLFPDERTSLESFNYIFRLRENA